MADPNSPRSQRSPPSSVTNLFVKGPPNSFRNSMPSTRKSSTADTSQTQLTKRSSTKPTFQKKLSLNLKDLETHQVLETAKSPLTTKEGSATIRALKRSPSASETFTSLRQSSAARKPVEIFAMSPKGFPGMEGGEEGTFSDTYRQPMSVRNSKKLVVSIPGLANESGWRTTRAESKKVSLVDFKDVVVESPRHGGSTKNAVKTVKFGDPKASSMRSIEGRFTGVKKKVEHEVSTPVAKPKVRSEKDKKKRVLSIIKVPTRYPDLEEKIKEYIIDSSFNENKGEGRMSAKEIPKYKQEFGIEYDEKETMNQNLNKSGMVWDVREKKAFNRWFDDVVLKNYLERVDKIAEYLQLGPADDSPLKQAQPIHASEDSETKLHMIQEKAAALLEGFDNVIHEQGTTKHMCYHPKSFPEDFLRYVRDAKDLVCKPKEEIGEGHGSKFLEVIQKAMQQKSKLRSSSAAERKSVGARSVPVPDMLIELQRMRDGLAEKYYPLYSKCKWNKKFEKEFQSERLDSVLSSNRCTFNQLNTASMLNFMRKSPRIGQLTERIEQDELNKKYQSNPLFRNFFNCKKLQEEINAMDKDALAEIEYKVANDILCKFENDMNFVSNERTKFMKHKNYLKAKEIHEVDEKKTKGKVLEEEKQNQKVWSDRVRLMLKLNESGSFTKPAKEVGEIPMLKNLSKTFSMIPRAQQIVIPVDKTAVLRCRPLSKKGSMSPTKVNGLATFMEEDRPRTFRLSSAAEEVKDKGKLQTKLKRVYSGGPRGSPGRVHAVSQPIEKLQKAVLKLQSFTRGIVARKTYIEKQEKQEMLKSKKSMRVSFIG